MVVYIESKVDDTVDSMSSVHCESVIKQSLDNARLTMLHSSLIVDYRLFCDRF